MVLSIGDLVDPEAADRLPTDGMKVGHQPVLTGLRVPASHVRHESEADREILTLQDG
jgi:hypothetical protein